MWNIGIIRYRPKPRPTARAAYAPLTDFVEELRLEAGPNSHIPYSDPWDGGIDAQVLLLLEAPGPRAALSGFISRNNPDETAKNFYELTQAAGLERKSTVVWNVVPWYIGSGQRIRAATTTDLQAGLRPLPRLLALLSELRVVVLIGRKAERAAPGIAQTSPGLKLPACPHPSPMYVNNAQGNRAKILFVLKAAAELIAAD
jgi:uracil-DNA glycosylase